MISSLAVRLPPEFRSLSDVERGLASLEGQFLGSSDRRGVFVSAYVVMTHLLVRSVRDARFERGDLVRDYIVAFANLYRRALGRGDGSSVQPAAEAWRISLAASGSGSLQLIQDLVLGVNAHVNHDLPIAILEAGVDPGCPACIADHARINEILCAAVPKIRRRIVRLHQPKLTLPSTLFGWTLDGLTGRIFVQARRRAFEWGSALRAAPSGETRSRILRALDRRAAERARRMLTARATPAFYIRCLSQSPSAARTLDTIPA